MGGTTAVAASDRRTTDVVVDAVLGIGLGQITGGQDAYLPLSRTQLLGEEWRALDPGSVVIEVLDGVGGDAAVVARCRAMARAGFRLAVDLASLDLEGGDDAVLEWVEVVKVDVLETPDAVLDELPRRLDAYDPTLLAEGVEDRSIHDRCVKLGFELFQGFHYFRPETLSRKDLSTHSVAIVRLLNLLRDMDATDQAIEEAFRSDPSLTYKLLRMVRSAALGARGVESIRHALRLLGREPLYRWLSLLLVAEGGGGGGEVRAEIVKSALVRGRMCELVCNALPSPGTGARPSPETLFLVGLFSHLDVLLEIPLDDALDRIDTTETIRGAVLEHRGVPGALLEAVIAYQDGRWGEAERCIEDLGADSELLPNAWLDALTWAGQRMAIRTELTEEGDAA